MNQDLMYEEDQQNPPVSQSVWRKWLPIILVVLVIIGLFYFFKDYLMPRQEITVGIPPPSDVRLSVIPELERY